MKSIGLYKFDDFEVDPLRRQLCRQGSVVPVPQKAFQLLLYLVENPGRVLTKQELMNAVWPKSFVEEANLTQSIFLLRKALGEQLGSVRYILTVPGEGYQFTAHPAITEGASPSSAFSGKSSEQTISGKILSPQDAIGQNAAEQYTIQNDERPSAGETITSRKYLSSRPMLFLLGVLGLLVLTFVTSWYFTRRPRLTLRGDIVLADFANTAGEPAFNAALKQGLAAELEQSPNLGLVSETRVAQTLKLMAQPADVNLSPELARQVCERTGSAASVDGTISKIGGQYVLGLRAIQCKTGDVLAQDQETADSKEHVLTALGRGASKLRSHLGESLPSLRKYDVPPQGITTGSLDALEAYGLGIQAQNRNDCRAALALYRQAISRDPDFAMAYSHIGVCDQGPDGVAATQKAYLLRDRVSERERFYLESHYEQYATGNLGAARKILEGWAETYPHDRDPGPNLLKLYLTTGEYERALPEVQEIVRNSPSTPVSNASRMATTLLFLNRVEEAKAVLLNAEAHHTDAPDHHYYLYEIDFLQNDSAAMAAEASYVRAQPGWESNMLELESVSANSFGKFSLARSLSDQAIQAAVREQEAEDAAEDLAEAALQEALAGNIGVARQKAKAALALSKTSDTESLAGMAQALSGSAVEAERTASDMSRRFPTNTLVQIATVTIRARNLLGSGRSSSEARRAIGALAPASPYMLSANLSLVPVYVLGQANLAAGQSTAAAAAFQSILDHTGITRNYITGPLARLGLAKAEEQAGDLRKARADYTEFLRLWNDADKVNPTLQDAKASVANIIHRT